MDWDGLSAATNEALIDWVESQSWGRAMAACLQDAEWHSEGDVWTHTQMVLRELERLDEWAALADSERIVLRFTALFHDVAKPLTSQVDPETRRVTSPKHAVKGEHVARSILREVGCDLATREHICQLVRYHGRPAFLLERDDPTIEVIRLSWLLSNRLLFLFAVADTRGRDTDAMSRPEENLHYWKLAAEEAACFDRPYEFANPAARFLFGRSAQPNRHYVPHEDYACSVTMMCGLPGSGKDTWLATQRPELPVVSLDEIRNELGVGPTGNQGKVAQLARERCREFLRAGTSFAFNATNIMRSMRNRWIDLFAEYQARVEVVYLDPPMSRILRQNRDRDRHVPESVIANMASKFEPPTWWECHNLTQTG